MRGELHGVGGLVERKAVGDERAHIQPARKDEAADLLLDGEIGGVAADEVFFVEADGGEVKREWRMANGGF